MRDTSVGFLIVATVIGAILFNLFLLSNGWSPCMTANGYQLCAPR